MASLRRRILGARRCIVSSSIQSPLMGRPCVRKRRTYFNGRHWRRHGKTTTAVGASGHTRELHSEIQEHSRSIPHRMGRTLLSVLIVQCGSHLCVGFGVVARSEHADWLQVKTHGGVLEHQDYGFSVLPAA